MEKETPPFCLRCGYDKKETFKENTTKTCKSWGHYYGYHLWSDGVWAKKQEKKETLLIKEILT